MVAPADFDSLAGRSVKLEPEKKALLKRVFDKVCAEAGIFDDAHNEREALASHLLQAAETETVEALLVASGHAAVSHYRREKNLKN